MSNEVRLLACRHNEFAVFYSPPKNGSARRPDPARDWRFAGAATTTERPLHTPWRNRDVLSPLSRWSRCRRSQPKHCFEVPGSGPDLF